MNNLSKDEMLLNFIENKHLNEKLENSEIYLMLIELIQRALKKTYSTLNNINYSINCSDMVIIIFWIILSYTNNLKLTMFLCERSIVLFTEYITLSNNINNNNSLNVIDIKLFIYKKTIGPLNLNKYSDKKTHYYKNLKNLVEISIDLVYNVFIKLSDKNIINDLLKGIVYRLYQLNEKNKIIFINNNILEILNSKNAIIYDINLFKIKLELYYNILNKDIKNPYKLYINKIKNFRLDKYYNHTILDKEIYEFKTLDVL